MATVKIREALRQALDQAMETDPSVVVFGEDVAEFGGAFKVTKGLWEKYGPARIRNTPISEAGIIGLAIGSAMLGLRPVAEVMFCDFLYCAMDQIANQLAKIKYMMGGQPVLPVVVRTTYGAGVSAAAQHSQSNEAIFMHVPGVKIAMPATAHDAKGLLTAAIEDPNPVLFYEHKCLYDTTGEAAAERYSVPFGECAVRREGADATVVATGVMVHRALESASDLEREGVSVEVIDPRTLVPLDMKTILESVSRTGRLVVAHEAPERCGFGAEVAARVVQAGFDLLRSPIERVCGRNLPVPFAPVLEGAVIPDTAAISTAVRKALGYRR